MQYICSTLYVYVVCKTKEWIHLLESLLHNLENENVLDRQLYVIQNTDVPHFLIYTLGLFGMLKLATLILALQFLLKQRLFQCCVCFLQYTRIHKSTAFAEISTPNKLSYTCRKDNLLFPNLHLPPLQEGRRSNIGRYPIQFYSCLIQIIPADLILQRMIEC